MHMYMYMYMYVYVCINNLNLDGNLLPSAHEGFSRLNKERIACFMLLGYGATSILM